MEAAMGRRVSFGFDSLIRSLRIVPCIVSILMLLLLPAAKAHTFGPHFRTPEVRRSAERHTSVAYGENDTHQRLAQSNLLPRFLAPPETGGKIFLSPNFESTFEVPLSRLLRRLKLKHCGSSGQDPLLSA
jgi:hypothetical protein